MAGSPAARRAPAGAHPRVCRALHRRTRRQAPFPQVFQVYGACTPAGCFTHRGARTTRAYDGSPAPPGCGLHYGPQRAQVLNPLAVKTKVYSIKGYVARRGSARLGRATAAGVSHAAPRSARRWHAGRRVQERDAGGAGPKCDGADHVLGHGPVRGTDVLYGHRNDRAGWAAEPARPRCVPSATRKSRELHPNGVRLVARGAWSWCMG